MPYQKSYYRIMLGKGSMYAKECFEGNWFGGDWNFGFDLTERFTDNWRDFNKEYIPAYLENNPGKGKVAAGLACSMLYTICRGINVGDVVLCPDGLGSYHVGEVVGGYKFVPDGLLRHQRQVAWYPDKVARADMSTALKRSTGSIGTVSKVSKYGEEIESLINGQQPPKRISNDDLIEDTSEFALEKHLGDFLVKNWAQTELGKNYDIYEDEGEPIGREYRTDTGPMDILAISKDKRELLVVELKKGYASDTVVGQVQRYMGYVVDELAEDNQTVKGVIIALEDDIRIQRALRVAKNIEFYRYQVSFKLFKS